MRIASFIFLLGFIVTQSCQTPAGQSSSENGSPFSEITFHTSPCFGSCPKISMHIDAKKNIEVTRQFFTGKVVPDTTNSGSFKGRLPDADYKHLLALIGKIDWETVDFPSVMCCDGPIRTIILTYHDKTYKFMSMTPPESSQELILYLQKLASATNLPRYEGQIEFRNLFDSTQKQ